MVSSIAGSEYYGPLAPPPRRLPLCRYVRLHFFDEDYLSKQDEVPDELEEPVHKEAGGYDDN